MKSKKAQEYQLIFLVELVAAIFIAYILIDAGAAYAGHEVIEKAYYARDIGLTLNTLCALPQDVSYVYQAKDKYMYFFTSDNVTVGVDAKDYTSASYNYMRCSSDEVKESIVNPAYLVLGKVGGKLMVSKTTSFALGIELEEEVDTKDVDWKKNRHLVLSPPQTEVFAQALYDKLGSEASNVYIAAAEDLPGKVDMFIFVKKIEGRKINFIVPDEKREKSKKLAIFINKEINSIPGSQGITSQTSQKTLLDFYRDLGVAYFNNQEKLKDSDVLLKIEIGDLNIQNKEQDAILDAIRKYYE